MIPTDGEIDWNTLPEYLTTREAATLLGKSPGNIRARASKGDLGGTTSGPDGLPRYDREHIRHLYERMMARQAQSRSINARLVAPEQAPFALPLAVSTLLTTLQAQYQDQLALCKAWRQESQELRALLREREETTRETLSHMDMLHDQNSRQSQEMLERECAHWASEIAAKDAEIERLKSELPAKKNSVSPWRR